MNRLAETVALEPGILPRRCIFLLSFVWLSLQSGVLPWSVGALDCQQLLLWKERTVVLRTAEGAYVALVWPGALSPCHPGEEKTAPGRKELPGPARGLPAFCPPGLVTSLPVCLLSWPLEEPAHGVGVHWFLGQFHFPDCWQNCQSCCITVPLWILARVCSQLLGLQVDQSSAGPVRLRLVVRCRLPGLGSSYGLALGLLHVCACEALGSRAASGAHCVPSYGSDSTAIVRASHCPYSPGQSSAEHWWGKEVFPACCGGREARGPGSRPRHQPALETAAEAPEALQAQNTHSCAQRVAWQFCSHPSCV